CPIGPRFRPRSGSGSCRRRSSFPCRNRVRPRQKRNNGVRHEAVPPTPILRISPAGGAANQFQHRAGAALWGPYTILWCAEAMPPDVAVNEFRKGGVSDSGAIRSRLVPQLKHRARHRPFPGRCRTDSLVLILGGWVVDRCANGIPRTLPAIGTSTPAASIAAPHARRRRD